MIGRYIVGSLVLAIVLSSVLRAVDGEAAQDGAPYAIECGILKSYGVNCYDTESLIAAVKRGDMEYARSAATFLGRLPRTPQGVATLREAAKSEDDGMAFVAMYGLIALKVTGWEDAAVERLFRMKTLPQYGPPPGLVEIADLLARAGRSEGWPIVRKALERDEFVASGSAVFFETALRFQGFKATDGTVIDAREELARAIERIRPATDPDRMLMLERRFNELAGGPLSSYLPK